MNKAAAILLASIFSVSVWADSSQDYEAALTAFNDRKYQEAYIHLKNSLQDDPNNLAAKILMGKLLLRNAYLRDAEDELMEALQMGADINLVLKPVGDSLLLQRKYEELLAFGNAGNLTVQSQFELHVFHASAYFKLENFDKAREQYQAAIKLYPDDLSAINNLISLELELENVKEAKVLIDNAMIKNGKNARLWQLRARQLRAQSKMTEAQSAMEYAVELAPEDPLILRNLADIYIATKNYEAAAEFVSKILIQTPDDPMALLLNSWLLSEQESSIEASTELEKLSNSLSELNPEAMAKEPMLLYINALSAFAQNNLEQARDSFEQYLITKPEHMVASLMLARTYLKLGKPKLAVDAMEPYARNISSNLDAALMLSELYLRQNKAFKALDILSQLQRAYPDEKKVDLLEIKIMAARGKFEEAIETIDQSEHKNSDISFILTKSLLLLEIGKIKEADYVADKLLDVSPQNPNLINFKSAVLIRQGKWDEALEKVNLALSIDPDHFSARYNLASIQVAKGRHSKANQLLTTLLEEQPDNVATLVILARTQLSLGQADIAESNLNRVLELDINNLKAFQLLADIYLRRNDLDRALRQVNNLIKHDEELPRYMLQKAVIYLRKNDIANAERQYQRIEKSASSDPYVMRNLAKIRLDAGDVKGALTNIKTAEKLHPGDLAIGLDYVWAHIANKDYKTAGKKLQALKKKYSANPRLMIAQGDLLNAQGKKEQAANAYLNVLKQVPNNRIALAKMYQLTIEDAAIDVFEQSIPPLVNLFPDNYFLRNLLADFYLNRGKADLAREHYEVLVEDSELPNRAFVLNNLANIYLKSDINKAQVFIEQAIELASNNASVMDTYGWIKSLQGQHNEALDVLRRAYAMNSQDPAIQYHLAYTLVKLGRNAEARSELTAALASPVQFSEREDAQNLLNSI